MLPIFYFFACEYGYSVGWTACSYCLIDLQSAHDVWLLLAYNTDMCPFSLSKTLTVITHWYYYYYILYYFSQQIYKCFIIYCICVSYELDKWTRLVLILDKWTRLVLILDKWSRLVFVYKLNLHSLHTQYHYSIYWSTLMSSLMSSDNTQYDVKLFLSHWSSFLARPFQIRLIRMVNLFK